MNTVQFLIIAAIVLGNGLLFVWRSKSKQGQTSNTRMLRGIGYGLVGLTAFLLLVGVLQHFDEQAHAIGH
ncbi:hypothetical protein EBB07_09120 [Paenibacillaceae bacterium]|nr:hypothetical protein EBB07_09120 [Paenibacillaceae bacterium]